jgi:hypothetical protein
MTIRALEGPRSFRLLRDRPNSSAGAVIRIVRLVVVPSVLCGRRSAPAPLGRNHPRLQICRGRLCKIADWRNRSTAASKSVAESIFPPRAPRQPLQLSSLVTHEGTCDQARRAFAAQYAPSTRLIPARRTAMCEEAASGSGGKVDVPAGQAAHLSDDVCLLTKE